MIIVAWISFPYMTIRSGNEAQTILLLRRIGVGFVKELITTILIFVRLKIVYEKKLIKKFVTDTVGIVCFTGR